MIQYGLHRIAYHVVGLRIGNLLEEREAGSEFLGIG
jgi:hypothetical protein